MGYPHIETIAIGDELVTGRIPDTNSTFVAGELFARGLRLARQTVIPDDVDQMTAELEECGQRAEAAVCFGGLGPTSDDRTVDCVATLLGTEPVIFEPARRRLLERYAEQGRPVTSSALRQVRYPKKAIPLENNVGLAPGFQCQIGKCCFSFLPGVPSEMRSIFSYEVIPSIEALRGGEYSGEILSHVWRCIGVPESELQGIMDPVESELPPQLWVGYRTNYPENHVILYSRGNVAENRGTFEKIQDRIRPLLDDYCYSERHGTLEEAVVSRLLERKSTLVLAESATGGLAVQRLTRVSGASRCVWGGFTCYQIPAKEKMLGVGVTKGGAVSMACTRQLAERAREISHCTFSAAVTGYMDPTGSTQADPIGTTYIVAMGRTIVEKRLVLMKSHRYQKQWGASAHLLNAILKSLA